MEKNKIPTARELSSGKAEAERMIEFAKLHVKAALEKAWEKSTIRVYGRYDKSIDFTTEDAALTLNDTTVEVHINKDSILNAYPETNIK